jgi:hypothetical protein
MLDGKLGQILFPFIGTSIPEGHQVEPPPPPALPLTPPRVAIQGTAVEGMSHCSVLSKLKTGFHKHRNVIVT